LARRRRSRDTARPAQQQPPLRAGAPEPAAGPQPPAGSMHTPIGGSRARGGLGGLGGAGGGGGAAAPLLEVDTRLLAPGLDCTPNPSQMKDYKYYCPLCMENFRGVLECECCAHYVCHGCALECVANLVRRL